MGHIVLAAPAFDRFHLIDRLARELVARGHRTSVLCLDPVDATFWSAQGAETVLIAPGAPSTTRAPLAEFAETDCRRRGYRPAGRRLARSRQRLAALLPGLLRFFDNGPPDLVCLHQQRTGRHRLVHFVARECGVRTLWTGEGLLPHTLQFDEDGLDAEARACRRSAWDFRDLSPDDELLAAALAAAVGRTVPPGLARRDVQPPPLRARLRDLALGLLGRHERGVLGALDAWRAAAAPELEAARLQFELPSRPFLAVVLQRDDDPLLRLDADTPPDPDALTRTVRSVARGLDRDMPVVAVLPDGGLLARELLPLRKLAGVQLATADAALEASIAATAIVTINDRAATAGLLAGTPVVHLGAALYGIPGLAARGRIDTLAADVARALDDDQPELRKRCLSWLFTHGHVWCSAEQPDHNGINGLVRAIEGRLENRGPFAGALDYRVGPSWPLAAEGRR